MSEKSLKLFQPPLLDFTTIYEKDKVKIIICNVKHKFAHDSEFSGIDIMKQPIFGSIVYINNKKFSESSYGLPYMRFSQGSTPQITYENQTRFTFNIHYHGLNNVGTVDGTSSEVIFGHNTLLGPNVTFQFPEITNNQCLLWFHGHNMFISMELIYGGILGLMQIVDKPTKWLTEQFQYGDNQILITALDMDLTSNGTQTFENLVIDENRSNFVIINGTSALNWYSDQSVPFVHDLFHKTSTNLIKVDILNASLNWRIFYVGVCDENKKIKSFYLVQNDGGLVNPNEQKIVCIPVASRIGIIVDLDQFKNGVAHLFFYNYDLTEIFASMPTFPEQSTNSTITGIIPDIEKSMNATPYPTPIPDTNQQNQQGNFTTLNYPKLQLIPQINQILENGSIKVPKKTQIKPFLKIIQNSKSSNKKHNHKKSKLSLEKTIKKIRKTIFEGNQWKTIVKQSSFEYNEKFNYLSLLNRNYYYNLPEFGLKVPTRNLCLFPEVNTNAISGGNLNGTTEYVDGANRIMVDLWNSDQLNLEWALQQYTLSPNNYKPPILPTSKFRIYKTNDVFSNTAMISNDQLEVEIFEREIAYGDFSQKPLTTVTIIFPPTPHNNLLNLQQWIDLINSSFKQKTIVVPGSLVPINLGTLLSCDWSFFPYALNFLHQKTIYLKSAIIKTNNTSNYWIRFLGRWPLLQFFGKPMTGNTINMSNDLMSQLRIKQQQRHEKMHNQRSKTFFQQTQKNYLKTNKNPNIYIKCDELGTYGTYDAEIQQIFPFYATSDGDLQLPIVCMKRNAELIISPQQTYMGLYDGYLNDNLNSFSVRLKSSENWLYTNVDCADAHALHFHMTSGYASPQSSHNSPGLISNYRQYDPLLYSRDVYQIGPQQTVSFNLTWPHYSSSDKTKTPALSSIGGMIHCHFLQHNDSNSMIIQYYIDKSTPNFFNEKEHNTIEEIEIITENNQNSSNNVKKCCCLTDTKFD
jgi:FtsP/CotA-like multicopper oxidase with cupredoxin domain